VGSNRPIRRNPLQDKFIHVQPDSSSLSRIATLTDTPQFVAQEDVVAPGTGEDANNERAGQANKLETPETKTSE
jgi:hypothetical protein